MLFSLLPICMFTAVNKTLKLFEDNQVLWKLNAFAGQWHSEFLVVIIAVILKVQDRQNGLELKKWLMKFMVSQRMTRCSYQFMTPSLQKWKHIYIIAISSNLVTVEKLTWLLLLVEVKTIDCSLAAAQLSLQILTHTPHAVDLQTSFGFWTK